MEISTFEECEGDELTQVWSVRRTRMLAKLGDSEVSEVVRASEMKGHLGLPVIA